MLFAIRALMGILAAWSVGMNSYVFWLGWWLSRRAPKPHFAWLYPLSVTIASMAGLILRVVYTATNAPFSVAEIPAFITIPMFAVAGFQGIRRIQEIEEAMDEADAAAKAESESE